MEGDVLRCADAYMKVVRWYVPVVRSCVRINKDSYMRQYFFALEGAESIWKKHIESRVGKSRDI